MKSTTMKSILFSLATITITVAIIDGVWHKRQDRPSAPDNTMLVQTYRTASGHPCTVDDMGRQKVLGKFKPGEEECREVGAKRIPVSDAWKAELKRRQNLEDDAVLCRYLRSRRLADLSVDDLEELRACRMRGL